MSFSETRRAVILAAGFGSRLRPLTDNHPKCLTELFGRSLLARQREVLAAAGLNEVTIVAGHMATMLRLPGLEHVVNADYARTNMVSSLFAARHLLDGKSDLIIIYGDIVFEPRVLASLMSARHDVSVVIDQGWHALWLLRMENPLADAETLKIGPDGRIVELGCKPNSLADIEGQYIGLIKFAARVHPQIAALYDALDPVGPYRGKDKANMFMTTFIQMIIDSGLDVGPAFTSNGWLEVDSLTDLEAYEAARRDGRLEAIYDSA